CAATVVQAKPDLMFDMVGDRGFLRWRDPAATSRANGRTCGAGMPAPPLLVQSELRSNPRREENEATNRTICCCFWPCRRSSSTNPAEGGTAGRRDANEASGQCGRH